MSTAFGHHIRRMTEQELNVYGGKGHKCTGRCQERAKFMNCYRYVTGRSGRTTLRESPACAAHAEKFAAKYHVELPADPAPPPRNPIAEAIVSLGEAAGARPTGHGQGVTR